MKTIYFITHPEVIKDLSQPVNQWKLSEEGKDRLKKLAQEDFWNRVQHIFSSKEIKSIQTAEILSEITKIPTEVFPNLQENYRTDELLEEKEYKTIFKRFFNYPKDSVRGWETASDAQKRIIGAISAIDELYPDLKTIAIIGHGVTGTLLLCNMLEHPIDSSIGQERVGCIVELDWEHKFAVSNEWQTY